MTVTEALLAVALGAAVAHGRRKRKATTSHAWLVEVVDAATDKVIGREFIPMDDLAGLAEVAR